MNLLTIWAAQDKGSAAGNEGIENDIGIVTSLFELIRLINFYLHQTCKGHCCIDINQLTLMLLILMIATSSLMNSMTLKSSTIHTANFLPLYITFPTFPTAALQRIRYLITTHHGNPSGRDWTSKLQRSHLKL